MEDSDQQSIQSGAVIGSNDDLLTEILLRLPVTSILRFKSVSKHWRLLLSHRHFTHRYDKLSKSPGLFDEHEYIPFDVETPITPPFRSLDSYFDLPGVIILQSCNGLLLCGTNQGPKGSKTAPMYYVFNPTTKQLETIPPMIPGDLKVRNTVHFMCLAFHQTDCVHYKLVCIRSLDLLGELFQIHIYYSDTRKWKISIESFSADDLFFCKGVYWNGAVHWAPFYHNHMYFKIDTEQLQTLPLPEGFMSSEILTMYFGESRGHLHLVAYKDNQENRLRLNVYEMFSGHSGWFVKYQLELDGLLGTFPDMISRMRFGFNFQVIDVIRGEDEEDTFVVLKTYDYIITYNVLDKSFKKVCSFLVHFYDPHSIFHRYIETLSSF